MKEAKNRFLTYIVLFNIFFIDKLYAAQHDCILPMVKVPFLNLVLNPNCIVSANYTFGINGIIFCYTNTLQTVDIITWPFQGRLYSGSLPIFLKTNSRFEGQFADAIGVLTIENTQNVPAIVSCEFAF